MIIWKHKIKNFPTNTNFGIISMPYFMIFVKLSLLLVIWERGFVVKGYFVLSVDFALVGKSKLRKDDSPIFVSRKLFGQSPTLFRYKMENCAQQEAKKTKTLNVP